MGLSLAAATLGATGLSGLTALGSSIYGAKQSAKSAKQINQAQLDYNLLAAQNKYQWEVEDKRKAGINPILSTVTGASANPMTAVMPDTSGYTAGGQAIANTISTASNAVKNLSEAGLADANANFTKGVKTKETKKKIENIQEDTRLKGAQIQNLNQQGNLMLSQIGLNSAENALKQAQTSNTYADTTNKHHQGFAIMGTDDYHSGRYYNGLHWKNQYNYSSARETKRQLQSFYK